MNKTAVLLLSVLIIATLFTNCNGEATASLVDSGPADIVVYGTVFTAEKDGNEVVEAFAVRNGRYVCVGTEEDVAPYIKEGVTKVIDRRDNGLIIPGCTEGHGHFVGIDALVHEGVIPGLGCTYKELLYKLREAVSSDKKPPFFLSWGILPSDEELMEDIANGKNFAEEIDGIAPDIPVIFIDGSGHQAICNTMVLKKIGYYDGRTVRGGSVWMIGEGENEKPSGIIGDELVPYAVEQCCDLSVLGDAVFQKACESATDTLHKRGFTNYFDAYLNYLCEDFYKHLKKIDMAGKLSVNVSSCQCIRSYESEEYVKKIDHARELADRYHSEHFNPYNIKLFADGVVETGTGWCEAGTGWDETGKYNNGTTGNKVWEEDELVDLVKYANSRNLLVHTHAYANAAVRATIDAYIKSNETSGKTNRNTLGHVRNINTEDKDRAAANHIGIAANMIWHYNDGNPATGDTLTSMLPAKVAKSGYPMKSLTDAGILVSSSTDAPCAETIEGNIMNIIEIATTGKKPNVTESFEPFGSEELLTVREVLMCLTINGARMLGIDNKCGSIVARKNADFVILDKNFLNYTEESDLRTIHEAKIQDVYFEGIKVL